MTCRARRWRPSPPRRRRTGPGSAPRRRSRPDSRAARRFRAAALRLPLVEAAVEHGGAVEAERAQHPPEARRPHHRADRCRARPACPSPMPCRPNAAIRCAIDGHHETKRRIGIGELSLEVEEVGAGNMGRLERMPPRHGDVGNIAAGRRRIEIGRAIKNPRARIAEARCELFGADERLRITHGVMPPEVVAIDQPVTRDLTTNKAHSHGIRESTLDQWRITGRPCVRGALARAKQHSKFRSYSRLQPGERHDCQHRRLGPYAVRQARHRDRGEPDRPRRQRGHGRRRAESLRHRRDRARPLQRRLLAAGLHRLAGAAGRRRVALQAGDAGRERLRDRLGRRASGGEVDRGRQRQDRAGGRRRADDHARRDPRSARTCCAPPICRRTARRRRLRRRVRQHRQGAISSATATSPTRSR